jgi:hypothetical protein
VIGAAALVASLAASSALTAPAPVTLSASPTHIALAAGARQAVRVAATGGGSLTVKASVVGFGLDARGRPGIVPAGDAASWVTVAPRTITIGRGGGVIVVSTRRPRIARPGDHTALVLLSAVAPPARGVVVHMRIGLVISVRVAGPVVHRLVVLGARVQRSGSTRLLELRLANRGNVIETIAAGRLRVTLLRHGRVIAQYVAGRRELLPGTNGIVRVRYRGHIRGLVIARIELWRTAHLWAVRRFRLRL